MANRKPKILIVDDEVGIRELLAEILVDEGYAAATADSAQSAWEARLAANPDAVLLDIWMPDEDGVTLLKRWREAELLTMPVIVMSGHATIDTAVEATKLGAVEVLEKPIAMNKLIAAVKAALAASAQPRFDPMIRHTNFGKSEAMRALKDRLVRASGNDEPVFFVGDSDSGVAFYARFLARLGKPWRTPRDGHFLEVAPLEALRESEEGILHIRFANLLNPVQQRGLLAVLREAPARDVRIIADSLETTETLAESGEYHADLVRLFARQTIAIPPLDDYERDIPETTALIAKRLIANQEAAARPLAAAAINALVDRRWDGGFNALFAAVRAAMQTAAGEAVTAEDIRVAIRRLTESESQIALGDNIYRMSLREAREVFEREYFAGLLQAAQGNYQRAAQIAGLGRTYLYRKFKQLNLVKDGKE